MMTRIYRPWGYFFQRQWQRVEFRLDVLWAATKAGLIWTVVLIGLAKLDPHTVQWAGPLVFLVWLAFAWPSLVFDLAVFADLINYGLTGRAFLLRQIDRVTQRQTHSEWMAQVKADSVPFYWYTRLALIAAHTSPLAPMAMWGLLVLHRLPEDIAINPSKATPVLQFSRRVEAVDGLIEGRIRRRIAKDALRRHAIG